MCILSKLSPECKQSNTTYAQQMRKLSLYFSSIDDPEIRENLIQFFEKISKLADWENNKNKQKIQLALAEKESLQKICYKADEEKNLPYIAEFSRYISKIDSIALKDKVIEMVKMIAE